MDIHTTVSVLQVVQWVMNEDIRMVRKRRLATALDFLEDWTALLLSRMFFWLSAMVSGLPSNKESFRMSVHTLDVLWLSSLDSIGLRAPTRIILTGRKRKAWRLEGWWREVMTPRISGRNAEWKWVTIGMKWFAISILSLILVALLKSTEEGLGGRLDEEGKAGGASEIFPNIHSDLECFIGGSSKEITHISGTSDYWVAKVS